MNTETNKNQASLAVKSLDDLMKKKFEQGKIKKEVYDNFVKRREVYKQQGGKYEVEEIMNIIGDYVATGHLNPADFDLKSNFGIAIKQLANGVSNAITGKDMFMLHDFKDGSSVMRYINRFYKNFKQGKISYLDQQEGSEEDREQLGLKQSKIAYSDELVNLESERTQLIDEFNKSKEGKSEDEIAKLRNEFLNNPRYKFLNKEISKIKGNIETSNKNEATWTVLGPLRNKRDKELEELIAKKQMLEDVGNREAELEEVINQINNFPKSRTHIAAENDLIEQNRGIVEEFMKKWKPINGITRSDFELEVWSKVATIINNYNPGTLVDDGKGGKTTVDFGYYLSDRLNYQLGNIIEKLTPKVKTTAIPEGYDPADDVDDSGLGGDGFDVETTTSELRHTIPGIDDDVKNKIIKDVAKIIDETGTPENKKKTRKKLKDKFAKKFNDLVREGLGTQRSETFSAYLRTNKELLIDMIAIKYRRNFPELSYVIKERASVEETLKLKNDPNYNGFIESTTAGNTIYGKVQFTDPDAPGYMTEQEFIDIFTTGRETRYKSLINAIGSELGNDATFDGIRENDPADIDNYLLYYTEIGKRDPNMKFSRVSFPDGYDWDNLRPNAGQIISIIERASGNKPLAEIIDLNPDSPEYLQFINNKEGNKFHAAEIALAVDIVSAIDPSKIDKSIIQFKSTLSNDPNVPAWLKVAINDIGNIKKNPDFRKKKVEQVNNFGEKYIGKELLKAYPGLADMFGYHNKNLDPAKEKWEKGILLETPPEGLSEDGSNPAVRQVKSGVNAGKWEVRQIAGWTFNKATNQWSGQIPDPDNPGQVKTVFSSDPINEYGAVIKSGDHYSDKQDFLNRTNNTTTETNVDLTKIRPMSKGQKIFDAINNILKNGDGKGDLSIETKLRLLKELAPEVNAANVENKKLGVEIVSNLINAVATGEMDADVYAELLQSQSSLIHGFRALSSLDFITVIDGAQDLNSYGEHLKPNVRLMLGLQYVMVNNVEFNEDGSLKLRELPDGTFTALKEGADIEGDLEGVFEDLRQFLTNEDVAGVLDTEGGKTWNTDLPPTGRIKLLSEEDQNNTYSINGEPAIEHIINIEVERTIREEITNIQKENEQVKLEEDQEIVDQKIESEEILVNEGEVHQKFSRSTDSETFNVFVEQVTKGEIKREQSFSAAQARLRGSQRKGFNNIIPYSAEDFKGLVYQFLSPGKDGEYQMKWFEEKLIKPYSRAEIEITKDKQRVNKNYKNLLKDTPGIKKRLKTPVERADGSLSNYTLDHAVRVYLWNKNQIEIPGISSRDLELLDNAVKSDPVLRAFADRLGATSDQDAGYVQPGDYWTIESIASDMNQVINEMSREKHLATWIEAKDEIFSKENLNKIEAVYGLKYRQALENMLYRMETGKARNNDASQYDPVVKQWDDWNNAAVGSVMFINTRSALLQTISMSNYLELTGPNNIAAAAGAFGKDPKRWTENFVKLWTSDYLVSRREGEKRGVNEADLRAAIDKGGPKGALAYLLNLGFTPTRLADSFAICSGGSSYVINYTDHIGDIFTNWKSEDGDLNALLEGQDVFTKGDLEYHLKGKDIETLTEQELQDLAYDLAYEKFVMVTESGQQSSRQDMLSYQQTGSLGKTILAFKNAPMQYTRKIARALQDIKNGRGNLAEHMGTIAHYGVIQNFMFNGLQKALFAALNEEDEEWDNKSDDVIQGMINSILEGTGMTGSVIVTVKNGILEYQEQNKKGWNADHGYTLLQFANLSPTIGSKLRKIYSSIKGKQYNADAIAEMNLWDPQNPAWMSVANVISGIANIPADRVIGYMNNLLAISADENEWWQNMALLLGYNTWDVNVETKAKKIKKEVKEIKKEEKLEKKVDDNQEVINSEVEEEVKKEEEGKGEDVNRCAASKSNGRERCNEKVDKAGDMCQYHASKEELAKKPKCGFIKKNKQQCANYAVTGTEKGGKPRCNVPQHQVGYKSK